MRNLAKRLQLRLDYKFQSLNEILSVYFQRERRHSRLELFSTKEFTSSIIDAPLRLLSSPPLEMAVANSISLTQLFNLEGVIGSVVPCPMVL
jgi:hypothetical protein